PRVLCTPCGSGVWSLIPAIPASLIPAVGAGEANVTVDAATWPFPSGPITYPLLPWRPGPGGILVEDEVPLETVWPTTAKDVKRNAEKKNRRDIKPPLCLFNFDYSTVNRDASSSGMV